MAQYTTNYNLFKPELTDAADITKSNSNWDVIDAELKRQADATPDVSGQITTHDSDSTAHADIRQAIEDVKSYTNEQIAAIPKPDVSAEINAHNTSSSAHSDIRTAITNKAPMYGYGTTDLVAGTSPLENGKLYFVYE